jgi:hypothetical protein
MHPSYLAFTEPTSDADKRELTLPGDFSEWLFFCGFWQALTDGHSRHYEQYEEEVMPWSQASLAASKLKNIIQNAVDPEGGAINFSYGWDADRKPLECIIESKKILNEAEKLIDFLVQAEASTVDIYCQL